MAQKKATDNVLQWIADEQLVHEQTEHGDNHKAVSDAVREQKKRLQMVTDYKPEVEKVTGAAKDPEVKDKVNTAYDELTVTADKRMGCLNDIAQIASLEDLFNSLSCQFAERATNLVADACTEPNNNDAQDPGAEDGAASGGDGVARAAQSCILSVRNNWQWISKLVKCTDIHLEHVSAYHQFFHTAKEYEQWMPIELSKAEKRLSRPEDSKGSKQDAQKLLLELKEILVIYLHWQGKINTLFEKSKNVIPIPLRTKPLETYRPISSLANYKTKEISIQETEELTLLDNSSPQFWLVRNMHAREANVPSVICLIPGPDPDAVALAMRLRLKFLGIWTLNVKRIGKTMIWFLLLVLNDPDRELASAIKSTPELERDDMSGSLNFIVKSLAKYWGEYPDFQTLQSKVKRVKEMLEESDGNGNDSKGAEELEDRVKTLDQLLRRYRDFWSNWETYKILVESSNHAEQILICDKWQQLNFINTAELLKKWHTGGLGFDDDELRDGDSSRTSRTTLEEMNKFSELMDGADGTDGRDGSDGRDGQGGDGGDGSSGMDETISKTTTSTLESELSGLNQGEEGSFGEGEYSEVTETEEVITQETSSTLESGSNGYETGTSTTIEHTSHSAETEQISTSEQEEKKTFVITGVIDPRSGEEVSMHQAVMLGIIDSKNGTYVNPDSGVAIPIPMAMNQGHIKVEFTTTKKSAEKKRDVGLITIKTQKESRPYTVKGVIDALSEKQLSVDEAIDKGILNQTSGVYRNTRDNMDMSLADALDSGLLVVEFDKDAPEVAPEVVTKTYAIHAVVDQRTKSKVSFTEAVRKGLIDKSTGAYHHSLNNEDIYVGDAIKKGFIKATVVKDPNSMDIDPENKMVIDKVETIRKKLLKPMRAMAAFKKAGASNNS